MAVRHRSLRFGPLGAVGVLAVALGVVGVLSHRDDAAAVIAREEAARTFLAELVRAQAAFRARGTRDDDRDGQPEYGTIEDLVASGLLAGPVARDAEGAHVVRGAYRFDVLLPAHVLPSGQREFAHGPTPVDPRLSSGTFAVAARPRRGAPRSLRSFYEDAAGYAYTAEGVNEPDRDPVNPLPRRELRGDDDRGGDEEGSMWRPTRKGGRPATGGEPGARRDAPDGAGG